MDRALSVWMTLLATSCCLSAAEAPALPGAKPVPRMQAVPLPHDQVSFERDGAEIARYHFGPDLRRPFVFPILGPLGRLTGARVRKRRGRTGQNMQPRAYGRHTLGQPAILVHFAPRTGGGPAWNR